MTSVVDARASSVLEAIPAPLVVVDGRGRIAATNPRLEGLVGRPRGELLGQDFRALGGSSERGAVEGPVALGPHVSTIVRADGVARVIEWEIAAFPVDGDAARHFVCVAKDVSEARALGARVSALEAEVTAARSRCDTLIRAFPGWVALLDSEGRVVVRSDMPRESERWLIGAKIWELPAIAGRADIQAAAREAFTRAAGGEPVRFEAAGEGMTGSFEVEVVCHPIRACGGDLVNVAVFAIDVRERNAAMEALRESEERLREAQQIARIGSWSLDLVTNHLIWSDEIFRIFEIDPASFGASYDAFLEAIHPDDRDLVNDAYLRSLAMRERYEIVHRLRMSDGRVKYVREIGRSSYDDEGRPLRSIGTVQDISAEVRADRALQQALAERETLLREIHHRVKNNLQVISSLLHFQAKKARTPADVAAFAEGRDRLLAMILVHEKLYQSQELSRVPFGDYVRSLTGALLASLDRDRRIAVDLALDDVLLPIEVALPSGMILCELLTNAFKYSFPEPRRGRVQIAVLRGGDTLYLRVSDDGIGFPEGFEPDAVTSFGWQLVRNLSAQLDASLTIGGEAGAQIEISIPLSEGTFAARPEEEAP
ncbi:MAG: PAS domain S-box protein [Myxococcales bacterium]|nr:PAS domain S-box protein [Myxococcales bacterium]